MMSGEDRLRAEQYRLMNEWDLASRQVALYMQMVDSSTLGTEMKDQAKENLKIAMDRSQAIQIAQKQLQEQLAQMARPKEPLEPPWEQQGSNRQYNSSRRPDHQNNERKMQKTDNRRGGHVDRGNYRRN